MLQVKLFVQYMYLSVVQKLAKIWCFFRSRLLWVKVVKFFPRLWQTVINQPSVHRGKTRGGSSFIGVQVYIVSTWKQPRGSIFQNGFLGGVQFKISLKKWTFEPKSGGLLQKNSKNGTFRIRWGSIQEWGCNQADTVYNSMGEIICKLIAKISHKYILRPSWNFCPNTVRKCASELEKGLSF